MFKKLGIEDSPDKRAMFWLLVQQSAAVGITEVLVEASGLYQLQEQGHELAIPDAGLWLPEGAR